MDILQQNIQIQKQNYLEIIQEYEKNYPKEYKTKEQKQQFLEKLMHARDDMEYQLEIINIEIDMLKGGQFQNDFLNQAKILENSLDELRIIIREIQFSSEVFNYGLIEDWNRQKANVTELDFTKKEIPELGDNPRVKEYKKHAND